MLQKIKDLVWEFLPHSPSSFNLAFSDGLLILQLYFAKKFLSFGNVKNDFKSMYTSFFNMALRATICWTILLSLCFRKSAALQSNGLWWVDWSQNPAILGCIHLATYAYTTGLYSVIFLLFFDKNATITLVIVILKNINVIHKS